MPMVIVPVERALVFLEQFIPGLRGRKVFEVRFLLDTIEIHYYKQTDGRVFKNPETGEPDKEVEVITLAR